MFLENKDTSVFMLHTLLIPNISIPMSTHKNKKQHGVTVDGIKAMLLCWQQARLNYWGKTRWNIDGTDCVAGLTHIVLLPKNVILRKECDEKNSPTHRMWTLHSWMELFWTTMTS